MKIAIYGQAYRTESLQYIVKLIHVLSEKSHEIRLVKSVHKLIKEQLPFTVKTFSSTQTLDKDTHLMISVGGDGTMLRAAGIIQGTDIPVIGINTGRMGFLANVHRKEMQEALTLIENERFDIQKRSLLEIAIGNDQKKELVGYALNEVTVGRKNLTSMITIETFLNQEYLNTYWADGLIVSTPTGSTGYNLSCNGPVIIPDVEAMVITPIAPHNLSIRPLVVKDNHEVKLKISSRETEYLLSMDSLVKSVKTSQEVFLKKAHFEVKMIELEAHSFLKTLREKLLWGKDTRN
jgi:NAD+ kinase